MRYAPSTGCFYPPEIEYPNMPSDAIDTTREVFDAWCAAPQDSTILVSRGELIIKPPEGPSLSDVKKLKMDELHASYDRALTVPVTFTTKAGQEALFAQDTVAKHNLDVAIGQSEKTKKWGANLWLTADRLPVIPFTYDDLIALKAAIEDSPAPKYVDLLTKIALVDKAKTIEAVSEIEPL